VGWCAELDPEKEIPTGRKKVDIDDESAVVLG